MILKINTPKGVETISDNIYERFYSSLNQLEDTFEIQVNPLKTYDFQLGNECTLWVNGKLILTGYITGLKIDSSGNILIKGASKTWLLTQSYFPSDESSTFSNDDSLLKILEKICGFVDIKVLISESLNKSRLLDPVKTKEIEESKIPPFVGIERDQTLLDNILEIIKTYGLFLSTTIDGNLKIFFNTNKINVVSSTGERIIIKSDINALIKSAISIKNSDIITASMDCSEGFRAREYQTIIQKPMRIGSRGENIFNLTNKIAGHSPLPITKRLWDNNHPYPNELKRRNIQFANTSESKTMDITIETNPNFLLFPQASIRLDLPIFKLYDSNIFMIESVEYITDQYKSSIYYKIVDLLATATEYEHSIRTKSQWISYN